MPNYTFACTACDFYEEDVQLMIASRDYPTMQPCPQCQAVDTIERVLQAPFIGDAVRQGRMNLPNSWSDKLTKMKDIHRGSTIKR